MPDDTKALRSATVRQFKEDYFDLIIIGGGITGAGIALDAASRGMKVALVEKSDFASGASSKSTKLIHGGLRYLKQFEIGLVREVGKERAIVHALAPHLVTAEKMLLPLHSNGNFGKITTSLGLFVYDFLADVADADKRQMLSKSETLEIEPLLRSDLITGGGLYAEYRTDDARLTIEIIKTALNHQALCLNYIQVQDFVYKGSKVKGVHAKDVLSGEEFNIQGDYVVSATGPWVDQIRNINNSLKNKHLFLSKGVHIVVPYKRLPVKNAIYFDVRDGRMVFAIPRQRVTYIGTTDTAYEGDLDRVVAKGRDVNYLLEATNNMFPGVHLTRADVESTWAGLRPLIHEEGKSASEMSRKDEIFVSATGLISIAGGKLTGYRKMAERIVDLVAAKARDEQNKSFGKCQTTSIKLGDKPFENSVSVRVFKEKLAEALAAFNLPDYTAEYLTANYGNNATAIANKMRTYGDTDDVVALARAELWYTFHHELVYTAMDFLDRRTGMLSFNLPGMSMLYDTIIQDLAAYLHWDAVKVKLEKESVERAIYDAGMAFRE